MSAVTTDNKLLAAALWYAKRGWPVFPCRPEAKEPLTEHGLLDATTDIASIQAWWQRWSRANVAIATGAKAGFFVLDVDPQHDGDFSLDSLLSEHGSLPDTIEALTGGGGRHLLFKHPGGYIKSRGLPGYPGIDVKGDGGYIIAAPSIHPGTGRAYAWELSSRPDEVALADAPDWLLRLAQEPGGNGHRNEPIPERITEGERNTVLTSLAGSLRRRGLSPEVILATLLSINESQCAPPLAEVEVRRIAASVTRYEVHHLHITRECEDDEPREPIDLATLPEPGPQEFVVEGFIPKGYITNLYADSGQGKSYLALHLSLSVITEKPFLGRKTTRGRVLYLDWELDETSQRRRWGEVTRGQGYEAPPGGLYYVRMTKPLVESLDEIYRYLDIVHPVLVIIDSVGKALGNDPVDHRAIIAFYSKAETLGTVLAIDHQPKPGGDTNYGAKWEFGSSYKRHLARSSWQLERIGTDDDRIGLVLRHKKTNFSALCADVHATLTFENGTNPKSVKLELAESPHQLGSEFGVRSAILSELSKTPSTAEQLAEALSDYDIGSIRNALTALRRAGLVVVPGRAGRAPVYATS